MRIKADIVLIDSGVNFVGNNLGAVSGCTLALSEDAYIVKEGFEDLEGHGTAVFSIFQRKCNEASYYIIKLGKEDENISSLLLQYALDYIEENIECKFVHMSLGVESCSHIHEFEEKCLRLTHKGIIIIAAFSNMGCVSYPAAYDCVIGVDQIADGRHFNDYEYCEKSIVNVKVAAMAQFLPWGDGRMMKVSGTSFSSPYITIFLYKQFKNRLCDLAEIKECLKENAYKVHACAEYAKVKKCFDIKKAIIFPFNKEIHSLVRFSNDISFTIKDIYDTKYLGNIGKKVSDIMETELTQDFIVKNIDDICWEEDFDTVIIGHTRRIEEHTKREYARELVEKCQRFHKRIYLFDSHILLPEDNKSYVPKIKGNNVPLYLMGKLYCISVPVLCIIGTSARQGKFTLQNILRKYFSEAGYSVGQLGTEPTAPLLGFDEVYPMGYESTVEVQGYDCVSVVNKMMHDIELNNPDIIIVGTQSQTVAASVACVENIPKDILYFLYGVNPDGFILVCNYFDPIEYILKTVRFVEAINNTSVIAIVMFPVDNDMRWSVLGNKEKIVDTEKLQFKKKEICEACGKKVYILGYVEEMKNLFQDTLNYFQGD